MKLWLARHAQPLTDTGMCYGASDITADDVLTQTAAQTLAQSLPQAINCSISPLLRCQQLAAALATLRPDLSLTLSPCTDPSLAEIDFGVFEMQPWASIPKAEVDAWTADFGNYRFGGQESANEVLQRVASALQAAKNQVSNPPKDTLWITHAGVIRAVRLLLEGVNHVEQASQWPRDVPAFGQWVCIEI